MARWLSGLLLLVAACGDNLSDDAPPSAVIDAPLTVRVIEGYTGTFNVKLATDPQRDVVVRVASQDDGVASVVTRTITLSSETYASGVAVELAGSEDDGDIINDTVEIELFIDGLVVHRVVATVMDNDVQQIVADATALTIDEAGSAMFSVRLTREPAESVTLDVTSSSTSVATVAPATLTFTPGEYAAPQALTVTSAADNDMVDGSATILVGSLPGVESPTVAVTVDDDDVQAAVLSTASVAINEGASATFGVSLAYDPLGPVSVYVGSTDQSSVMLQSLSTLAFDSNNYNVAQTVTLDAIEDVNTANEVLAAALSGAVTGNVAVAVTDNDQINVASAITLDEGQSTSLTVTLANDPGPANRIVDVQVISGDAAVTNGTLTFTSADYATGLPATVTGAVDAYSTANKSAVLRVSSPGQVSRDVAVTVRQRIPGSLHATLATPYGAGATGSMQLRLWPTSPWPGDGQLELNFPPAYDVSGVTLASSNLDGSLSLVATAAKLVLTRSNGTASPIPVTVEFEGWRNPSVSGNYTINIVMRSGAAVPIDQGTLTDRVWTARLTDARVALASLQPGATGNVTFTFTTINPWPADGGFRYTLPFGFDASNAAVVALSGVDGTLTQAPNYSVGTLRRSGGTTVPAGTFVSITLGNVVNPPVSRETSSFSFETTAGSYAGIDDAYVAGVIIGCPVIRREPRRVYSVPFGTRPWQWSPDAVRWGYPATATAVGTTDLLVVDDFRFALPQGATITGIELDIRHDMSPTTGNEVVDSALRLVKGGTIGQTDRSSSAPWVWWTSAMYGGATDLWGETWTSADILSSTFGVAIAARSADPALTRDVGVGSVTASVYLSCP